MGAQGRVVLPSGLREELGLAEGDELIAHAEGDKLVLERREAVLRDLRAELRQARGGRSLVDELITQRRREASEG